ncbi:TIGR02588 family protein [Azospirillum picis]|uniref:Uncharacterized protein (TIGR02588 family) n=1 Tax=Azospirillum picis TaxID=488438 RepID=A0ABU0MR96_9PROT|nr:TIGR02588 family protein [Azospirillum picis]MBP2302425.1 uncharacterized protein (TIGR02588 family) [Azospirillum picis]MDQ0536004.1 uncharacterized protein (TIGR02588 family) [Azospirillum picis]
MAMHSESAGARRQEDASRGDGQQEHAPPTSPWEWVAAGFGVLLIAAMIGYMVQYGLREGSAVPGDISVAAVGTQAGSHAFTVRFKVKNETSATAAGLRVQGELKSGDRVVETAETTFDYLPPYSSRYGGLIFENDPSRYELHITPSGYNEP